MAKKKTAVRRRPSSTSSQFIKLIVLLIGLIVTLLAVGLVTNLLTNAASMGRSNSSHLPNLPPFAFFQAVPAMTQTVPNLIAKEPFTVSFSNKSTDPNGDPLTYSWDFGDGSKSTSKDVTHTYTITRIPKPGYQDFITKLTAYDSNNLPSPYSIIVRVIAGHTQ